MPRYVPLSPSRHGGKSWRRFETYAHAASNQVVQILYPEAIVAAAAMPLAFVREQEGFVLAAPLSIPPSRNAFVAPQTGKWLGSYVPATFRIYPFLFIKPPQQSSPILCIDEDAGLLEASSGGEALFDADGKPTEALQGGVQNATVVEQHRQATALASAALAEAGLLVPWDLRLVVNRTERAVDGLFHVDYGKLVTLADDQLLKLQRAQALGMAYAQLVSEGRVADLQALTAQLDSSLTISDARRLTGVESLDTVFGVAGDGGTIRF